MDIWTLVLLFLGEKREDGGQNHCTPTIGFTFRKGERASDKKKNIIYDSFFQYIFCGWPWFLACIYDIWESRKKKKKKDDDGKCDCTNVVYWFEVFKNRFAMLCLCQTDTASVLSEAIEYIKFLHEQVTVSPIKFPLTYD